MPFAKLDDLTALVIAHNAGEGNLMKYPDIPSITKRYLDNVRPAIDMGGGCSATAGRTIGKLAPPLAMQPGTLNVDVAATGTPVGRITTYATGQCTWWAAARRLQIGKPVDGYMGDGWMWASSARKLGYPTGGDIQLGDVASFTERLSRRKHRLRARRHRRGNQRQRQHRHQRIRRRHPVRMAQDPHQGTGQQSQHHLHTLTPTEKKETCAASIPGSILTNFPTS